jgi:hypothetical protein
MTVEQATQILADQLLRQVDLVAGTNGGWNQDAANYLKSYAIAHQGENVGKDQWGNAVPLFGTYSGYQRNDATVFSANPQTTTPPNKLGIDAVRDYFFGIYQGVGDTLSHPIDTLWGGARGLYGMVTEPVGTAKVLQEQTRVIVTDAGDGNFVSAGNQTGTEIGGTIIGAGFGAAVGGVTSKLGKFKLNNNATSVLENSYKDIGVNASEIASPYSLISAKPEIVGPYSLISAKPEFVGPYSPLSARNEILSAQKLINNGRINADDLLSFVPGSTIDSFFPSNSIASGFKFQYELNGTRMEVKWHSPDSVAAAKFPTSNSGNGWTAQIKIGNKLLGSDGYLYTKPSNITHIPLDIK